ncbi:MAG TPA: DUF192 domain-containing protein [Alphaproteobacteria bacterium]|jgi:uncharacterized membrane protein (UPF0127 family)|nr:DUF192 domain-containing protein [Alphaproteobacteria bacterium]HRK97983.1 DUF192 domain-containing protein [Alphaproteobacteria bacterium]
MKNNVFAILFGFGFALCLTVCCFSSARAEELRVEIGNNKFVTINAEIARTENERAVGLMNRTHLEEDAGMLFIFPDVRRPGFWMKNTLIPLDMIFIDEEGKISDIHRMAKPKDLTLIMPDEPVHAVLEINGGMADKLGISIENQIYADSLRK